jgi:glucose-6-phosphate 1-dehydrogenase
MWVKQPGFEFKLEEKELVLAEEVGEDENSPEAYERVLFDCIVGDQTRFVTGAEVESSWQFVTPILESFSDLPLEKYEAGSAGPEVKNNSQ